MSQVHAWWMISDNFGDKLNHWMIEKITACPPIYDYAKDHDHFVCCGSILAHTNKQSQVWGAGFGAFTDTLPEGAPVVHAVRGPLTANMLEVWGGTCPNVYGDPALLLPQWHEKQEETRVVGVVPHYADMAVARELLDGPLAKRGVDYQLIDMLAPIEEVIDAISRCCFIYSSALHGLIVADAYGIPSRWVQFTDRLYGDGLKFADHFASIGRPFERPINATASEFAEVRNRAFTPIPDGVLDKLWEACPLPIGI